MNDLLLTQWQRLIFPPAGVPVRAGEQLREGNRYPDVTGAPDWQAHQDGRRTYAVNPVFPGPGGSDLCRWAVLDLDEGADSLNKARALLALCAIAGLSARAAWSGGKGCHVWLFFEPAPVSLVRAVQNRLRAAVPFTGELIPGELCRAKVPPAFHQEKRFWAFWFETLPDPPRRWKTPLRASWTHRRAFWRAWSLRLSLCWRPMRTRAANGGNLNRNRTWFPT